MAISTGPQFPAPPPEPKGREAPPARPRPVARPEATRHSGAKGPLRLFCRAPTGRVLPLEADPCETIGAVKQRFLALGAGPVPGRAPEELLLCSDTGSFDDCMTLIECNVQAEAHFQLREVALELARWLVPQVPEESDTCEVAGEGLRLGLLPRRHFFMRGPRLAGEELCRRFSGDDGKDGQGSPEPPLWGFLGSEYGG